jgi:hypothetical protein
MAGTAMQIVATRIQPALWTTARAHRVGAVARNAARKTLSLGVNSWNVDPCYLPQHSSELSVPPLFFADLSPVLVS